MNKKATAEKLDKVAELATEAAEEIATNVVKFENKKEEFVPQMPPPTERAPHGFNYCGRDLRVKMKVNFIDEAVGKPAYELISLENIKGVFFQRYVDNMFIENPMVMETKIWLHTDGRCSFGTIDEKQFAELQKRWRSRWTLLYTYYHMGNDRKIGFTFNHPDWPTNIELAEKMEDLNSNDVRKGSM